MTTAYSNLLGLALPVTGELSGTWGDTVNDYITKYLDDAIANAQIISGSQTAVTLSKTTGSSLVSAGSGATGSAQYALIRCTGNPASTLTITVSYSSLTNAQFSKTYLIFNSTSTSQSVVVQATTSSGTSTGVTITSGEKALIAWNGTDFVKIATQSGTGEFVTVDTTNLEVTNIKAKDGTAAATIADSTGAITVSTILNVDNLRLDTNTISSTDTNGNIVLAPNGTGDVQLDADTVRVGDSNVNVTITSNGTADLILNTNAGTNSGSITIEDGANGNIIIAPNGTGQVQISNAALDLTTIEVTNIKAKDGTASMTLADSTGVASFSANPILSGGTANAVAYLNGSKVLTTGSALTFDGTNLVNTSSSVGTPEIAIANSATSAGANARLRIKTGGSGSTTYGDAFIQFTDSLNWNWSIGAGSSTSNNLTFNQYFGLTSNELMRLTSTGLGIGTNNPGAKLNVQATGIQGLFQYDASNQILVFHSGSNGYVGTLTNQPLILRTNNTDRATLDTSGNLGLGVTPSAWYSTTKAIDINSGGSVYGGTVGFGISVSVAGNSYFDANVSPTYKVSGNATEYRQTFDGKHIWYNAPSGTADGTAATSLTSVQNGNSYTIKVAGTTDFTLIGAANNNVGTTFTKSGGTGAGTGTVSQNISFTQAMTLNASGNLLLGTTVNYSRLTVSNGNSTRSGITISDANTASLMLFAGNSSDAVIAIDTFNLVFKTGANVGQDNGTERARITSTGGFETRPAANGHAVFNEDGVDADFRVEGDTDTHLIFADASTDRVGIGTNNPLNFFQLGTFGAIDGNALQCYFRNNVYYDSIDARDESIKAGYSNVIVLDNNSGGILFQTTSTSAAGANVALSLVERARITSGGNLDLQKNIGLGGASATTSGTGITFPATQSASSDANTLDDYEEGVFVATITTTSGSITLKGTSNELAYTKVGRLVTVTGMLIVDSVSTPSGGFTINNLPFPVGTLSENSESVGFAFVFQDAPSYTGSLILGVIDQGATSIATNLDASTVGADDQVRVSFSYFA